MRLLFSRHFRASFLVLAIVCTAVCVIAGLFLHAQHKEAYRRSVQAEINQVALSLQESLNGMKTNAVFMGYMKSMERTMSSPEATNESIGRMIQELGLFFNQSSYEAVQVFFMNSRRVYVSGVGMYGWDDYFDQELLEVIGNSTANEWWTIEEDYERPYYERSQVGFLRYMRKCPINKASRDGFISIAQPLDSLAKVAEAKRKTQGIDMTIFFEGQLIYASDQSFAAGYDAQVDCAHNVAEHYGMQKRMQVASTHDIQVQAYYCIEAARINSNFQMEMPKVLLQLFGLCALLFLIALCYSHIMMRPMEHIMRQLGDVGLGDGHFGQDEFERIGAAVSKLNAHVRSVEAVVQKNLPIVKERIISAILFSPLNARDSAQGYKEYGIEFVHAHYAVVVFAVPELRHKKTAPTSRNTSCSFGRVRRMRMRALGAYMAPMGRATPSCSSSIRLIMRIWKRVCARRATCLAQPCKTPLTWRRCFPSASHRKRRPSYTMPT